MSKISLADIFKSHDPARDKFLSRLMGIFSEHMVKIWAKSPQARYENLGRPTITTPTAGEPYTLDFTFRSRHDHRIYVSEMKCELEYEDYKYLVLNSPDQLEHHQSDTFDAFLATAREPGKSRVTVEGDPIAVHGAILVWGHVTQSGREAVAKHYGFADVLSVQDMASDLVRWGDASYQVFLHERARWCEELEPGFEVGRRDSGCGSGSPLDGCDAS